MPLWLIGKYKTPQALQNVNLAQFPCTWRHNIKAWMTGIVMAEWLQAFYVFVGKEKRILLLLDNFSAHMLGEELAPPPSNIRIIYLPANNQYIQAILSTAVARTDRGMLE